MLELWKHRPTKLVYDFVVVSFHGVGCFLLPWSDHLLQNARNGPFCQMRAMKAQIKLRIRAVWSEPSLPAYSINKYCAINRRTEQVLIKLSSCVGPSRTSPSTYAIITLLSCCISFIMTKHYRESWGCFHIQQMEVMFLIFQSFLLSH